MKFIAQGGVSTKNTPHNSRNAFLLALNIKRLDGIGINVHLTKDEEVVILNQDYLDRVSNAVGKICDFTLEELTQLNFGSRVKRHDIVTLEEVLSIMKEKNKILVIQLTNQQNPEQNKVLVDHVIQLLKQYPNIQVYLKSSRKDTILYFNTLDSNIPIGFTITNTNILFEPYRIDFYSLIRPDLLNQNFIQQVQEQNRFIMIQNVDTKEQFNQIKEQMENIDMDTFIISNQFII